MAQKILVSKYNYDMPKAEFEKTVNSLAPAFADVAGCLWKIWLLDDEKKEAGAVYLFNDEKALDDFKNSELVATVMAHPALSNFDLRVTDILAAPSHVTNAPLQNERSPA